MTNPSSLSVTCPVCQSALSVDPATGAVLAHKESRPQGPVKDLDQGLQSLRQDADRRKDLFRKSLDAEKNKGDLLKKKFDEAFRQAQADPDAPPPPREIDL